MSGNNAKTDGPAMEANPLAQLWANLFEQSNQQAKAMLDLMKSSSDPQEPPATMARRHRPEPR